MWIKSSVSMGTFVRGRAVCHAVRYGSINLATSTFGGVVFCSRFAQISRVLRLIIGTKLTRE